MLIFLYFENFVFFCVFFELLENMCHTTQAVGKTLKEKENYFWYFWKWVSHDADDQTHTI